MIKRKKREYKINTKILAESIFLLDIEKYLVAFGSTDKAKEEIKNIIELTFKEIVENLLNNREVEIRGLLKFNIITNSRFLSNKIKITLGASVLKKLKTKRNEFLKESCKKLSFSLKELEKQRSISGKDIQMEEINTKKNLLKKLENVLKTKKVSINPKYNGK